MLVFYLYSSIFLSLWAAVIISRQRLIDEVLRVARPPDIDEVDIETLLGAASIRFNANIFLLTLLVLGFAVALEGHLVSALLGTAVISVMALGLSRLLHNLLKPIFVLRAEQRLSELGSAAFEAEDYASDYVIRHTEYALKSAASKALPTTRVIG